MHPSFIEGGQGPLFLLHFPPDGDIEYKGNILYIQPLAEEMNKSRRMVALQAKRFAAQGYSVALVDLYGCGDSGGDFVDARWLVWLDDLQRVVHWLQTQADGPLYLWGLRTGALLAAELAQSHVCQGLIMWQPVLNGGSMVDAVFTLAPGGHVDERAKANYGRSQSDTGLG